MSFYTAVHCHWHAFLRDLHSNLTAIVVSLLLSDSVVLIYWPDLATLDFEKADRWIEAHAAKWMELPPPPKLSLDEFLQASRRGPWSHSVPLSVLNLVWRIIHETCLVVSG